MTYQTEVMADSPAGYWKMDGTAGTDSSTAGTRTLSSLTAILDGIKSPVKDQAVTGAGWYFNGASAAQFTMPTITTAFSFETWFKTTAPSTKNSHTLWRSDGTDIGVIRLQGASAVYPGQVYGVIGTAEFNTGTAYNDNAWHHVVVTVAGTAVKVYVDKVLKNNLATGKSSYAFNSTGYLGRPADGLTSEYLIGSMDEAALYTTTLSQARVEAHYDAAQVALSTGGTAFQGWGVPL